MVKKIYHILLVFYPILSGYGFSPQLDFGALTVFCANLIYVFYKPANFKLVCPKGYGIFFCGALILSIFFLKTLPLRLILYSINLAFALHCIDIKLLKFYYSKAVLICCLFFLVQEISYRFMGLRIRGLFSLMPIIYGNSANYINAQRLADRSTSFFLEASYFAQFLFPYIVFKLFSLDKRDIKYALLVSVIMIMIESGNGVILLLIIWGLWSAYSDFKLKQKFYIGTLIALIVVIYILLNGSLIDSLFDRTSELQLNNGDKEYESSGFIRFFRGYYLYAEMPLFNQLFGSGKSLIEYAMKMSPWNWERDRFMNGIQTLLIYNGLFICVLYLRHILLFLHKKGNSKMAVALVSCFMFLMFSESYYLCSRAFLTTLFIYGIQCEKTLSQMRYA